jgi:hypothetical protein
MISGIELSETAKLRFPANVVPVKEPIGKYDLVVSTGTLYQQYDHEAIYDYYGISFASYLNWRY